MRFPNTIPALALATLLSLGAWVSPGQAVQASPVQDSQAHSDQPTSDTWITTKVKAELASTDGVKSTDISVKTVNGEVTLIGVLASDTAVKKAVAAARGVKGVTNVDASGLKVKD
ncbi:BON domain-containing protein [Dyella halodurans]|uniref:BON domain-containing protein n=1 Tax=Dyella halodurans TaxID=1920171 RepID=A0ABV9BXE3_9GAMM|nr:BON domain-containing protein [Dyella halodurans]